MLVVKLKDAPGVADGDSMLGENDIYYRVWEVDLCVTCDQRSRRLTTGTS